jgi:hypothetical protein
MTRPVQTLCSVAPPSHYKVVVALGLEPRTPVFYTSCRSSPSSLARPLVPLHTVLVESCGERNDHSILTCYMHFVYHHLSQSLFSFCTTNILGLNQVLRPVERPFEIVPATYITTPSLRLTKPGYHIRPLFYSVRFLQSAKINRHLELQLARKPGYVIAWRDGRRQYMARKI